MLYYQVCKQSVDWIGRRIKDCASLAGKKVLPVIQSAPEPGPLSLAEFKKAVFQTHCQESLGLMVLSWEAMTQKMRWGWRN
jgi:hypothetical protein